MGFSKRLLWETGTSWPHTNEKNLLYFLERDDSEPGDLKIGFSPLWMILSLLIHV